MPSDNESTKLKVEFFWELPQKIIIKPSEINLEKLSAKARKILARLNHDSK